MNLDCWFVKYADKAIFELPINLNAHEVLFRANEKSRRSMTKIVATFQWRYDGQRVRTRKQKQRSVVRGRVFADVNEGEFEN